MARPLRLIAGALMLLGLAAASIARPAAATVFGISDQHPDTVLDPRFKALGITTARLVVPWDAIDTEPERLYQWLKHAQDAGVDPLVAFEHARGDRCPSAPCTAPSLSDYAAAFQRFHQGYPWVRIITPWNEANHSSQPTAGDPARAAGYYDVVTTICPSCTVPAADVLDDLANMPAWLASFRAAVHGDPQLWGLHNYSDTNRFRTTGTDLMLQLVPGEVWLTETGGIIRFSIGTTDVFPYDEDRAARALDYMFDLTAARSDRITRAYIYQWQADDAAVKRFDAGLVGLDASTRPGLTVVQRRLAGGTDIAGAGDPAGDGPGGIGTSRSAVPGIALPVHRGRPYLGKMRSLVHLLRGHRLAVPLLCPAGSSGCRGRLELRSAGRPVRLATVAFSVAPGRAVRVLMRLGATGVRRLRMLAAHSAAVRAVAGSETGDSDVYGPAFRLAVPQR